MELTVLLKDPTIFVTDLSWIGRYLVILCHDTHFRHQILFFDPLLPLTYSTAHFKGSLILIGRTHAHAEIILSFILYNLLPFQSC
jgi:hypothetical protein